jgi:hypothetical protein
VGRVWNPDDTGEWWKQRGSFLEPVTPPTTDICDAPLYCITVNQEWLPYLAGAAMQLAQPSTWQTATEADRQLAIARATDLIAEIGTAMPCISPPAAIPGVGTAQQACNIAGYLANVLIKDSIQKAIDAINANQTVLGYGALIVDTIPGTGFIIDAIAGGLYALYNAINGGTQSDYTDALADPTLWSQMTCAIYDAIVTDGGVTTANFSAIQTNVAAITYAHSDVITTISNYLIALGASGLQQLQGLGALAVYDCSSCGSGVSTGPAAIPPRQAAGTVSVTIPAGSATAGSLVTFSPAFGVAPIITLGVNNADLIASVASAAAGSFLATVTAAVDVTADTTAIVTWSASIMGSV